MAGGGVLGCGVGVGGEIEEEGSGLVGKNHSPSRCWNVAGGGGLSRTLGGVGSGGHGAGGGNGVGVAQPATSIAHSAAKVSLYSGEALSGFSMLHLKSIGNLGVPALSSVCGRSGFGECSRGLQIALGPACFPAVIDRAAGLPPRPSSPQRQAQRERCGCGLDGAEAEDHGCALLPPCWITRATMMASAAHVTHVSGR